MSKLNSGQAPEAARAVSGDSLPRISRRTFARETAAMAAAPFALVSQLCGETATPWEISAAGLPLQDKNLEADAKLANAIRQFGDRLSDEQRQRLRRILLYNEKMLNSIRAVSLENGDPPASVLKNVGREPDPPENPF